MTDPVRGASGRFWRRRECWWPTWRTTAIGVVLCFALGVGMMWFAHPFLAVTRPVPTDILVVEGWCDDFVMSAALAEFNRGGYSRLLVTGGPMDKGGPLSEYGDYAELGAATLRKLSSANFPIAAVPGPRVDRDRTYSSAVALRRWFEAEGLPPTRINLMTGGAHARRSRLLFQEALGAATEVGILAIPDHNYDPKRWWKFSYGVRDVIGELIAYGYAITFFQPAPPAEPNAVSSPAPANAKRPPAIGGAVRAEEGR